MDKKLKYCGLNSMVLTWFKSSSISAMNGVPQGSILGPPYIIFISVLPTKLSCSSHYILDNTKQNQKTLHSASLKLTDNIRCSYSHFVES